MPVRPLRPRPSTPPVPARAPAAAPDAPPPGGTRSDRCAAGALLLAAAAALAGCSLPELPMQRAAPAAWAPGLAGGEACVVENPAVGLDLLAFLRASLAERGFGVRQLPPGSPATACATTVFYTASWSRDASARVLATAQLRVWRGGRVASEAIYDATRSSVLDLRRYRSAEARIDAMVGQLFPAAAAVPAPAAAAAQAPAPAPAQQIVVPVTVAVPVAGPAAVPMPMLAPTPTPTPTPTPIFIPGPGEPPAPVPTSPVAPGGGGRTVLPF